MLHSSFFAVSCRFNLLFVSIMDFLCLRACLSHVKHRFDACQDEKRNSNVIA